jgi:alpha-galactosidase
MPQNALAVLRRLVPPDGRAAEFDDEYMRIGAIQRGKERMVFLFNWGNTPQTIDMLTKAAEVTDFWSGESLGRSAGGFTIKDMPPRSARLFLFKEL